MALNWRRLLLVFLLATTVASAQDAHFWNKQYGNRAYMLGGAVIGSSNDVSAVYYNPALLTISDRPSLTVAGNAFETTTVTLSNALGEEADLTSSTIGAVPSLVAGEIPLGGGGQQRLAYSLLFRQDFDFVLEQRGLVDLALFPTEAEVRVSLEESGSEIWSGLSYAHRLDDALSLGISVYASYRTHRSRRQQIAAAATDDAFTVVALSNDFDYTNVGLVAKLGAGGRSGRLSYGLTVTTPTLHVSGTGSKVFDLVVGLDDPNGGLTGETISDVQDDLQSEYRTPLAVGAGLAYRIASTTLHVSAEWFDNVSPYRILDAERVLDEGDSEPLDLDTVTGSKSITNLGLGLEHEFGDRLHGYLGFNTDRSAASDADLRNQLAVWDIYHASGGVSLALGGTRIALGAVYSFGDEPLTGAVDEAPGSPGAGDSSYLPQDIEAHYRSFLLLIGFDVNY